jgi:endonuclease/exonuclease/phosphatase family metal-dependent hydrolase
VRKLLALLATVGLAVAGFYFFNAHFTVERVGDGIQIVPRKGVTAASSASTGYTPPPVQRQGDTIRIASFNIEVFGESKMSKPHVTAILAEIVRRFDIVAIQEVRAKDQSVIPAFVDQINQTGRQYDWAISERIGRTVSKEQYVFIFDTASVEIDRNQLYVIDDRLEDLLHREPYVAHFRVRGPPSEQAFTFKLVNIHTDPDETEKELDVLAQVFRKVQGDGANEDDVILLGDLNVDDQHLGLLGQIPGIDCVIKGTYTNTLKTAQYDNIIFHAPSTREFTGRGGVFDFLREFNLDSEQAKEISDHLPVWAEFTLYEGGQPGRVAAARGSELR